MGSGNLKPSPAIVLGIIALVLALGGTAIAGPDALSRAVTKSKVKKIAKRQANEQITQRAPDLAVASAESANPVAFAHVLADGSVDAANSRGIAQANVTSGSPPGYYCFDGLSFTPRGGNVTFDWNTTGSIDVIPAFGLGGNPSCPSGTDFFVDIRVTDFSGSVPTAFFLTLYR
jgi:hypothetical protein